MFASLRPSHPPRPAAMGRRVCRTPENWGIEQAEEAHARGYETLFDLVLEPRMEAPAGVVCGADYLLLAAPLCAYGATGKGAAFVLDVSGLRVHFKAGADGVFPCAIV